ncbi:hypothetical protein ACJW31_03G187200 [Castanea mollissima]
MFPLLICCILCFISIKFTNHCKLVTNDLVILTPYDKSLLLYLLNKIENSIFRDSKILWHSIEI